MGAALVCMMHYRLCNDVKKQVTGKGRILATGKNCDDFVVDIKRLV